MTALDNDIERARRSGYTHLLVTHHVMREGALAGITVRSSFGLCSKAAAVRARENLTHLEVVSSCIYQVGS